MLNWLRRYWNHRRKLIFDFWDGERLRRVDPIDIAFAIESDPEYLPRHLVDARAGKKQAIAIIGRAACRVFGVQDFDAATGKGMTLADRITLFYTYSYWVDALKKNTQRLPA